ncbi:hypothetical protein O9X98_05670 [Agrobacterium salinitolerans]|nr:hypothetical protein [Agrobacterium salinitolerans]
MSKSFALNAMSSVGAAATSAVTTWMIAAGHGVPTGLVIATTTLSLLSVAGVAGIVLGELADHRDWQRQRDEGRRQAERSNAQYRVRPQDQHHMDELEQALTAI